MRCLTPWLMIALVGLPACSMWQRPPEIPYRQTGDQALYELEPWSFDGRISLTGQTDSWSADIAWQHYAGLEQIKLSGPLGQGAVKIRLSEHKVSIARGDEIVETSEDPHSLISRELGVFVPVNSLRYWVVGVPEPNKSYQSLASGFSQGGWQVDYKQMQAVNRLTMPRKIAVTNKHVKLKLIIDEWLINDGKSQ